MSTIIDGVRADRIAQTDAVTGALNSSDIRVLNDDELNVVAGGSGPECNTSTYTISNDAGIFTVSWGSCNDGQKWVQAEWHPMGGG
jgi:hypothetical protein